MPAIPPILDESGDYYPSYSGFGSGYQPGYSQMPYYSTSSTGTETGTGTGSGTSRVLSEESTSRYQYGPTSGASYQGSSLGYSGSSGPSASLSASQCRANGLTAADLLAKGFTTEQLQTMGFTNSEIQNGLITVYGPSSPELATFNASITSISSSASPLLMGSGVAQNNLAKLLAEESYAKSSSSSGSSSLSSTLNSALSTLSNYLTGQSSSSSSTQLNTPSTTGTGTSSSSTGSTTITNSLNSSTTPRCNTTNNICSFESFTSRKTYEGYKGNSSIAALNAIVSSTPNSKWMASDKYFNVGFDEIAVASVYNRVVRIDQPVKVTFYATNRGYLFVNDFMYVLDKETKTGSGIYMIQDVAIQQLNQDNYLYLLLPGNTAILCNDNPLYTNTSWRSIAYDLNQSFRDADPIEFGLNKIKSRVISNTEVVYPLTTVPVTLNVQRAPSAKFICNSAVYQTYTMDQIKSDKEVKTIRFAPLNPITMDSANFVVNFQIFASNTNFKVYGISVSAGKTQIKQVNEGLIFAPQTVNTGLTVYSQAIEFALSAGKNYIVVVAPEKSFIYVPGCIVLNAATRATVQWTTTTTTPGPNPYITDENWRYKIIRIPYYQFDYVAYSEQMDRDLLANVQPTKTSIESFSNQMQTSYEGFNDTVYSELPGGILEEEYIYQSERRRGELRNMKSSLNSDDKFNIPVLRENVASMVTKYFDDLIGKYNKMKADNNDTTKADSFQSLVNAYTKLTTAPGNTVLVAFNKYLTTNSSDPAIQAVEKKRNEIGDPTAAVFTLVPDDNKLSGLKAIRDQTEKDLKKQLDSMEAQLGKLTTATSTNNSVAVEKEYKIYMDMVATLNQMTDKMATIQSEYTQYYTNLTGLLPGIKKKYSDMIALINGDMATVVAALDKAASDKSSIAKYVTDATALLAKPEFILTNAACPIKTFDKMIQDNQIDYEKVYSDPTTGFSAKMKKIQETHTKMTEDIKKVFLVNLASITSKTGIDAFIKTIDFSYYWNNTTGAQVINDTKTNLTNYLTAYFDVVNLVNQLFGKQYTGITDAMITEVKTMVDNNLAKMKQTYNTELTNYTQLVNTANGQLTKMKAEQNTQPVTVIKGYYDSIKATYDSLARKPAEYSSASSDMIKQYNQPFKDMVGKIKPDDFTTMYNKNKTNLDTLVKSTMGTNKVLYESFSNSNRSTEHFSLKPIDKPTFNNLKKPMPVVIKAKTTTKDRKLKSGYTLKTGNFLKLTFKGDIGPENMVMRVTYSDGTNTLYNYDAIGTTPRTLYFEYSKQVVNIYIGFTNDSTQGGDRNIRFSEIMYNFRDIKGIAANSTADQRKTDVIRQGFYPWTIGFDYNTPTIQPVEYAIRLNGSTIAEILTKDQASEDVDKVTENTYSTTPLEKAAIWAGGVNPGTRDKLSFIGLLYLDADAVRSGYLQLSLSNLDTLEAVYFNQTQLTKSGDRYNITSIQPRVYHFIQIIIQCKKPATNNNSTTALNQQGVTNLNSYVSAILYDSSNNTLLSTTDDMPDRREWRYSFYDVMESFSNANFRGGIGRKSSVPLSEEWSTGPAPAPAVIPRPMVRQVPVYQNTSGQPESWGMGSGMGWSIHEQPSNLKLAYAYRYEE